MPTISSAGRGTEGDPCRWSGRSKWFVTETPQKWCDLASVGKASPLLDMVKLVVGTIHPIIPGSKVESRDGNNLEQTGDGTLVALFLVVRIGLVQCMVWSATCRTKPGGSRALHCPPQDARLSPVIYPTRSAATRCQRARMGAPSQVLHWVTRASFGEGKGN